VETAGKRSEKIDEIRKKAEIEIALSIGHKRFAALLLGHLDLLSRNLRLSVFADGALHFASRSIASSQWR
jgi:hypothetical protein